MWFHVLSVCLHATSLRPYEKVSMGSLTCTLTMVYAAHMKGKSTQVLFIIQKNQALCPFQQKLMNSYYTHTEKLSHYKNRYDSVFFSVSAHVDETHINYFSIIFIKSNFVALIPTCIFQWKLIVFGSVRGNNLFITICVLNKHHNWLQFVQINFWVIYFM